MTLSRFWHVIRKGLDMREISIKDRKKKETNLKYLQVQNMIK